MDCLAARAVSVLECADARGKAELTRAHAGLWLAAREAGELPPIGMAAPPEAPARPAEPALRAPREMPRRRPGSAAGRLALIHAVAHIEINAIDLHWDIIARFAGPEIPAGFFDDWVRAADDEARHFLMLEDCLRTRGSHYGALPAHDGMWQAASDTAGDLLARLAIVPMVLEARGLDVSSGMVEVFARAGEHDAADALAVIRDEEVTHVAYGAKWYHYLCGRYGHDPKAQFHRLVRRYFRASLKPPFDTVRRAEAGLPPDYYLPLAAAGAG